MNDDNTPTQYPQQPQPPAVQPQPYAPATPNYPPQPPQPGVPSLNTAQPLPPVTPPSGPSKGLIIGIVIGVFALISVIVLAVVYFAMFFVSKDEYKKTAQTMTQIQELSAKTDETSKKLADATLDPFVSKENVSALVANHEKAYGEFEAKVDELKDQRTLRDSDYKTRYDAFIEKYNQSTTRNKNLVKSMEPLHTTVVDCGSTQSQLSAADRATITSGNFMSWYDKTMQACTNAINQLVSVPDQDAAQIGKDIQTHQEGIRNAIKEMESAYRAQNTTAYYAAVDKLNKATDDTELKRKVDDSKDKISKSYVKISQEFNDLKNYVDAKAS